MPFEEQGIFTDTMTGTLVQNRDKNMIYDISTKDAAIYELYNKCKNDIQKIRSENPSPKLKEANINVIKEASMKLTAIANSYLPTHTGFYYWYDEIPTLTSSNPIEEKK